MSWDIHPALDDTPAPPTTNEPLEVFECEECGEIWEDDSEASLCCPREALERYQCSACKKVHRVRDAAAKCCPLQQSAPAGEDFVPLADLERLGQLSLLSSQEATS